MQTTNELEDHTVTVTFAIASEKKDPKEVQNLVEAYLNEACSKLEAEGLEVTYRLRVNHH